MENKTRKKTDGRAGSRMRSMAFALLLLAVAGGTVTAQQVSDSGRLSRLAVRTNLLYGATTTLSLGMEYRTGMRTSLALSVGYNPWTFGNDWKLKHYMLQGEYRYWFKEAFAGHFAGLHGLYSRYNVGGVDVPLLFKKEYRYDGSAYGAGISYGYHLPFGSHWGLEFNAGIGYARLSHGKYLCGTCGKQVGEEVVQYFGPTRAGISIAYRFGASSEKSEREVTPDGLALRPSPDVQQLGDLVSAKVAADGKIATAENVAASERIATEKIIASKNTTVADKIAAAEKLAAAERVISEAVSEKAVIAGKIAAAEKASAEKVVASKNASSIEKVAAVEKALAAEKVVAAAVSDKLSASKNLAVAEKTVSEQVAASKNTTAAGKLAATERATAAEKAVAVAVAEKAASVERLASVEKLAEKKVTPAEKVAVAEKVAAAEKIVAEKVAENIAAVEKAAVAEKAVAENIAASNNITATEKVAAVERVASAEKALAEAVAEKVAVAERVAAAEKAVVKNISSAKKIPAAAKVAAAEKLAVAEKAVAIAAAEQVAVSEKAAIAEKAVSEAIAEKAVADFQESSAIAAAAEREKQLAESRPYTVRLSSNALDQILESNPEHLLLAGGDSGKNSIDIQFPQGSHKVDAGFADNGYELEEIIRSIQEIESSSDSRVTAVFIAGYASPEGGAAINKTLAGRRAEALRAYISRRIHSANIRFITYNGEMNYRELRALVAASSMPYRDRVLDIIDNTPVWDSRRNIGRRGELMRLAGGEPYRYMYREFFPKLRVAAYVRVLYDDRKK